MYHQQLFASGETIREQKDEIARLHGVNDRLRAEIERLRSRPCPYVTGTVTHYCTLTPFTLTENERIAIQWVVGEALSADGVSIQATLRGLLARTETVEK